MKKIYNLLVLSLLFLSCSDDLKNNNILSSETIVDIENGVLNSEMYAYVMESITNTYITYQGDTIQGEDAFETYFSDHRIIRDEFEKSSFYSIFNRRIRDAETEELKEEQRLMLNECKNNYEKASYSVSLGIYMDVNDWVIPLKYDYMQYILLDDNFKVMVSYCPSLASDNVLFKTAFPCN